MVLNNKTALVGRYHEVEGIIHPYLVEMTFLNTNLDGSSAVTPR